jgi:hypothetical protein
MAKKASPLPMLRLSMEMPDTSAGNAPARSARMAAAMSSVVQRAVMRVLCLSGRVALFLHLPP